MEKSEIDRLETQLKLMRNFDCGAFGKAIKGYDELYVLDVGSNTGAMIMDRFKDAANVKKIIGLEYNGEAVESANGTYGSVSAASFYQLNVEDADFVDKLLSIMESERIEKFNIVVVSMLLLHLKNPQKLLSSVRKVMADRGTIIIRDIDDRYNIAYPDANGDYSRVIDICSRNETSGFRYSGRQILTQLSRAGFKDINIEKIGLTTAGLSSDEREALFRTYFQFVLEDLEIMVKRYPEKAAYADDYEWFSSNYEDLFENFLAPDFYFSLGFMLYTAKN